LDWCAAGSSRRVFVSADVRSREARPKVAGRYF
jgi:hypothetical protein